ncbi:MAG: Thymidylate kinase [Candidatus Kaiserbacteria bacterium GW2011_GWB1_52_6]|uniref:Thymidylate kinase n=2 Tax=Candidatus Kaiseribacteriota TaxID=1752734 RepID=A0A0G1ZFM6_9BACT|nr:MAG: Thymidylate kinase [Candidatus Kaiserbacteria bacterium GW2011_GWA2_52_12]KKW26667.1 MAG: Thymidylate kinase [Candidatus Kaiserbacteria bacterium GW2011_GWB1_52_6]
MDKRGKLIVIDGSDGSGKATQTKLLYQRLKKEGIRVHTLDFPRYEDNMMGKLIGECIAGAHGDFLHSDPYVASVLYAADRFESKTQIQEWLFDGHIVVLDRFVSANQIHQGGKIAHPKKRKTFLKWLERMEYGVFGLPKPDFTIYLCMPIGFSIQLLQNSAPKKRGYLKKGAKDTVEMDIQYMKNAQKSAELLMKENRSWHKIVCAEGNTILPREVIHEKVYACAKKHIRV